MKIYKSVNPNDYDILEDAQVSDSVNVDFTPITNTVSKIISLIIILSVPILLFTFSREYFTYIILSILVYCIYLMITHNNQSDTVYDKLQVIRTQRPDLVNSIENFERIVQSIEKKSGSKLI